MSILTIISSAGVFESFFSEKGQELICDDRQTSSTPSLHIFLILSVRSVPSTQLSEKEIEFHTVTLWLIIRNDNIGTATPFKCSADVTLSFCFCLSQIVHNFLYNPEMKLAIRKDAEPASFPFPGVFLWENFISEEEEKELISNMDQDVWNQSQSGRRKQVMWNTQSNENQHLSV